MLLVPVGDTGLESQLCKALKDVPNVTGVVSYVTSVGSGIPSGYLESEITEQFYSGNFARIILYTDMDEESPEAFETVRLISDTAGAYYNEHYLAGQSPVLYDMKNIVTSDNKTVSLFAVIGIFLVILVTYRSPRNTAAAFIYNRNCDLAEPLVCLFFKPDLQLYRISCDQHRSARLDG